MNREDYSKAVLEVITFFGTGKVLASPDPDSAKSVFLVERFSTAKRMAREDVYGARQMTWFDIQDDEVADVMGVGCGRDNYNETEAKLWEAYKLGLKGINLGKTTFSEVFDEVCADFHACLCSRAFQDRNNAFFESIFLAYQCGGWPCGWKGDFPDGILAVYFPLSSSSKFGKLV